MADMNAGVKWAEKHFKQCSITDCFNSTERQCGYCDEHHYKKCGCP